VAVHLRLAGSQHVQVGAMKYEYGRHDFVCLADFFTGSPNLATFSLNGAFLKSSDQHFLTIGYVSKSISPTQKQSLSFARSLSWRVIRSSIRRWFH